MSIVLIGPAGIREYTCKCPLQVDDPRWTRMKQFSGLGDVALEQINSCVGLYREELRLDAARGEYSQVWKLLRNLIKAERKALQELKKLNSTPEFLQALRIGLDGQDLIPPEILERIARDRQGRQKKKERDIKWWENALTRLHHNERSGGWQSLLSLVMLLNEVLKRHTKNRIRQGSKNSKPGEQSPYDYVLEVCKFANPELSESSVREAVKQIVKGETEAEEFNATTEDGPLRNQRPPKKPRREQNCELGNWHELVPGCENRRKYAVEDPELGIRVKVESGRTIARSSITRTGPNKPKEILTITLGALPG